MDKKPRISLPTAVTHLVEEIGWALRWKNVTDDLHAARTADNGDIVDALLALYEARQKKHRARRIRRRALGCDEDPPASG
jgi:hypothetical protein